MLEAKFERFSAKVKSRPGSKRDGETITETGYYKDKRDPDRDLDYGKKGRIVEMLEVEHAPLEEPNYDNVNYYLPRVYIEISKRLTREEPWTVVLYSLNANLQDKISKEAYEQFPKAFEEFNAFRGFVNYNGQKGAFETKYFKEANIKGERNELKNSPKNT